MTIDLRIDPGDVKVGGLQRQNTGGETALYILRILCNAEYEVLRLSRRVNNMALADPVL